jgi:hypothetical protein
MIEENCPEKAYDSIYTDGIAAKIADLPDKYNGMSDEKLTELTKPNSTMYALRQSWWREISVARQHGKRIRPARIYEGICSRAYFFDKVMTDHRKVAWLIKPVVNYDDRVKGLLEKAVRRFEDILDMSITVPRMITDPETKKKKLVEVTDPKAAAVLLQAIKNVEDRVKGTPVQRQAIQTEDINKTRQIEETRDVRKIDERLKELQQQLENKEVRLIDENTVEVQQAEDNEGSSE